MLRIVLKYLFYFVGLNFIVLALFTIKYQSVNKQDFFYINNEKYVFNEVDVGVFGHSQSQAGIDEAILSRETSLKVYNFSKSGAPLYYTAKLIDHFISKKNDIKVILGLGTNNIGKFGSLKELLSSKNSRRIKFLSENIFFLNIDEIKFFFLDSPADFYLSIFRSLIKKPLNFTGSLNHDATFLKIKKREKQVEYYVKEKWEWESINQELEKDKLKEVVKNNNKTEFVILRIPEVSKYVDWHDNESEFNNFANDIKNYSNVSFYDFVNEIQDQTLFRDYNHLASEGKRQFTIRFVNFLNYE